MGCIDSRPLSVSSGAEKSTGVLVFIFVGCFGNALGDSDLYGTVCVGMST